MSGKNLDRKLVKEVTGKAAAEFEHLEVLVALSQGLTEVKSLNFLPVLRQLDLSKNGLSNVGAIASCTTLKWLNIAGNQVSDIKPLCKLPQLQVLNVAHNALAGALALEDLPALCALIANDNAIAAVKSLGDGGQLNTVVLKSNRISSLGKAFHKCPALAKLSVAHNQISNLSDSLDGCKELAELRIGHNQLEGLPDSLRKNVKLKLVDLGSNLIESWKDVKVLQALPKLQNLTLKGCPLASSDTYAETLAASVPRIQVLDTQKFAQRAPRPIKPTSHAHVPISKSNQLQQDRAAEQQIDGGEPTLDSKKATSEGSLKRKKRPAESVHELSENPDLAVQVGKSIKKQKRQQEQKVKDLGEQIYIENEPLSAPEEKSDKKKRKREKEPKQDTASKREKHMAREGIQTGETEAVPNSRTKRLKKSQKKGETGSLQETALPGTRPEKVSRKKTKVDHVGKEDTSNARNSCRGLTAVQLMNATGTDTADDSTIPSLAPAWD